MGAGVQRHMCSVEPRLGWAMGKAAGTLTTRSADRGRPASSAPTEPARFLLRLPAPAPEEEGLGSWSGGSGRPARLWSPAPSPDRVDMAWRLVLVPLPPPWGSPW